MPNYNYKCKDCEHRFDLVVKYAEREDLQTCEICFGPSERQMVMPAVMKAAYPDGHKRAGFADLKALARLSEVKANTDFRSSDAKEINKELDEREKKSKIKIQKD